MKKLLILGWIAPLIYILGSIIFGILHPEYNSVSQTLSEIGEVGSPFYTQWMLFDLFFGVLIILFSIGLFLFSKKMKVSILPVIFILCFGLANIGSAIFASPHSLHNVFGATCLIWYHFTPLMFYFLWKNKIGRSFRMISLAVFVLMIVGTILNLNPLFNPLLFSMDYYGIAQRFAIFTFYSYIACIAISASQYSQSLTRRN